jgi:tetratricopeptide (TPR) repeat protein
MKKNNENVVSEFVIQGRALWESGDLVAALNSYEKAVAILKNEEIWFVEYSDILEGCGHIHRAIGNYEKAIECYEQAWGEDNLHVAFVCLENLNDYIKAKNIFLANLNKLKNASEASAAFHLAEMSANGKGSQINLVEALKWMYIATSIDPVRSEFQVSIEQLKIKLSQYEIESANFLSRSWLRTKEDEVRQNKENDPWFDI